MCSSNGSMPGQRPSYTRSAYWPSASRHDCQLPSSIARVRSLNGLNNCAWLSVAAPRQAATAQIKPMPAQIPVVLARVNGEAIEKWEFESAVKRIEARAGTPVPTDKRDEVLRGVLDRLVAFHLLEQESRNRKIEVTDAEVDARMGDIRRGFPNEQAFAESMSAQGLTVDQVRQQSRAQLQVSKIIDAEVASASVQDSEIGAFYEQNLPRFKQDESVHASHILIAAPENAAPAQKAEARSKAQSLLRKVRGGADFATVARAESQDPGSAQNGGDL